MCVCVCVVKDVGGRGRQHPPVSHFKCECVCVCVCVCVCFLYESHVPATVQGFWVADFPNVVAMDTSSSKRVWGSFAAVASRVQRISLSLIKASQTENFREQMEQLRVFRDFCRYQISFNGLIVKASVITATWSLDRSHTSQVEEITLNSQNQYV